MKRQAPKISKIITKFGVCNKEGFNPRCPRDNTQVTCQIVAPGTCIYKIECTLQEVVKNKRKYRCDSYHYFTTVVCCDFTCSGVVDGTTLYVHHSG